MSKNDRVKVVAPGTEQDEIQQILQEIPEEILIRVIADRIQQEPDIEVKNIVRSASQRTFSGQYHHLQCWVNMMLFKKGLPTV